MTLRLWFTPPMIFAFERLMRNFPTFSSDKQKRGHVCEDPACSCLALTVRRGTEPAAEEGALAHVHPCIHASIVLQPCAEFWRSV